MHNIITIAENNVSDGRLPMVSILVINYNNACYIHACLNSIVKQTYGDYEIIIADDCSTDNSEDEIKKWLGAHSNLTFKYIQHETNAGNPSATCNTALRHARGKYISLISSDDLMHDRKLEIQVAELENTDDQVGALYSDAQFIDEKGHRVFGSFIQHQRRGDYKLPGSDMYDDLCKRNFIPAMSILYKKEIFDHVGFFDEELTFEDYDMLLKIAKNYSINFSEYVSVSYRLHDSSLSSSCVYVPSQIKIMLEHQDCKQAFYTLKELAENVVIYRNSECLPLLKSAKQKKIRLYYYIGKLPGGRKLKEFYLAVMNLVIN